MLDREKIVAVLKKRFPGAAADQVAAATNAIVGLEDEWEELAVDAVTPLPCYHTCLLWSEATRGGQLKVLVLRRRIVNER